MKPLIFVIAVSLSAADIKVDLKNEQVGKAPMIFRADRRDLGRRTGRRREGDYAGRPALGRQQGQSHEAAA